VCQPGVNVLMDFTHEDVDESFSKEPGFMSDLCRKWGGGLLKYCQREAL
jgi:hypothetical protein